MSAACGIVTFDPVAWAQAYPDLARSVTSEQSQAYFVVAETLLSNQPNSVVVNTKTRAALFNMLVAHIAQLFAPQNGEPARQTVGRVSSASEGSVSVSLDFSNQPPGAAWYNQTPYGALYWIATTPYRLARYRPGPQPYLGVGTGYGGLRRGY
jgi:hypothetical protein